ncbi:MAG: Hpt domain-containing protein [Nitrospira sp.]|nr:Hpt domain-containing protein [Nitrospira sp.]
MKPTLGSSIKNHDKTTDTELAGDRGLEHTQPEEAVAEGEELVHIDASFEPLIPKFLTNRKKEVVTMQTALAAQDFETVRTVAHGMKGAGGSYGFDRITDMAAVVEQAAKTGDASTLERDLPALGSYLDQVKVVYD